MVEKPHLHGISVKQKYNRLEMILKNDDLKEFIDYCESKKNAKGIKSYFMARCSGKTMKCDEMTPLTCVLLYNTGQIAKHVIKDHGVKFIDFWTLLSLIKKNTDETKRQTYLRLMLDMLMYSKLSKKEAGLIINKLAEKNCFDIIDVMHGFGHRADDNDKLMTIVPHGKITSYLEKGYKLTHSCFVQMVINNGLIDIDKPMYSDYVKVMGDQTKHELNRQLIKLDDRQLLKKMIAHGFVLCQCCLKYACQNICLNVVIHCLEQKIAMSDENFKNLLLIEKRVIVRRKRRRRRRYYYGRYRNHRSDIQKKYERLSKIKNYDTNMVEIMKMMPELKFDTIKNSLDLLLYGEKYKLLEYLTNRYGEDMAFTAQILESNIGDYIRTDNLDGLKTMFKLNIIQPIDISTRPGCYDLALMSQSEKMMEYFANELNMRCGLNMITVYNRISYRKNYNVVKFFKNIDRVGHPINNTMMNASVKNNHQKAVKYLHEEKKLALSGKHLEIALAHGYYGIVEYIIKSGCEYKKKNLIDRVITKIYASNKAKRSWYRSRPVLKCTVKLLNYMKKLGGTMTKKSVDKLVEIGMFGCLIHCHKRYGYVPSLEAMHKFINREHEYRFRWWYQSKLTSKMSLKVIKYMVDEMKMDLFGEQNKALNIFNEKFILNLLMSKKLNIDLLDYLLEKTEIELTGLHLLQIIRNSYRVDVKLIDYLENKGVKITKDQFLTIILMGNYNIVNHICDTHQFDITLQDLHNVICGNDWLSVYVLNTLIKVTNTPPTPYTVSLVVNRYIDDWGDRIIRCVLNHVQKMTLETKNIIINSHNNKLKHFIRDNDEEDVFEIVEYEPSPDEIPDFPMLVAHDPDNILDDDLDDLDDLDLDNIIIANADDHEPVIEIDQQMADLLGELAEINDDLPDPVDIDDVPDVVDDDDVSDNVSDI